VDTDPDRQEESTMFGRLMAVVRAVRRRIHVIAFRGQLGPVSGASEDANKDESQALEG
jgi:hypothetical protein